jgi:hypothetical protein
MDHQGFTAFRGATPGARPTPEHRYAVLPARRAARNQLARTVLVAMLAASSVDALAQASGGPYAIPRQSIDGGAVAAASASFQVRGTVGQADAAPPASGAVFSVRGGFHAVALVAPNDAVFADGFEIGPPAQRTAEESR